MIYDINRTEPVVNPPSRSWWRRLTYRGAHRRRWFPRPVPEQAPLSDLLDTGCTTCEVTA